VRACLVVALLLFAVTVHAEHIQWQSDYEAARQKAQKEDKGLLVLLFRSPSEVSQTLIQRSLQEQSYIAYLNRHYVAVIVFADQQRSYPIELLYTLEYPALFFLDAHEIFTHDALSGEITPEHLHRHLGVP